jgi:hypothetical protein
MLVNDADADERKQYLQWRPGLDEQVEPRRWYRAVLD